jgi:hypothetical protein
MRVTNQSVLGVAAAVGCAAGAGAQCAPGWTAYPEPQLDNGVRALAVWDPDGPGPAAPVIVAAGNFTHVGSTLLTFVGMWDGSSWSAMGDAVNGTVECATLYDPDGGGPMNAQPVVGGYFTQTEVGGTTLNGAARFDGSHWMPFGSGVTGGLHTVYCATEFGGSLFIGGYFDSAGGVPVLGIARWDGLAWHALSDQRAGTPDTLTVAGGSLYAGGYLDTPVTGILRWDGANWNRIGTNYPQDDVRAIAMYQGQLYAAGDFSDCCGGPLEPGWYIARFDGAAWQPVGTYGVDAPVRALQVFDPDGPGPLPEVLIAGGGFTHASGVSAPGIAAWNGTTWSALGSGTSGRVRALAVWNHQLVVGGEFYTAGGLSSPGMALWGCPQPASCYPNCDQSTSAPILSISDFSCFLNAFAAASPYANCDGSTVPPVLNIADFGCFLNRFAAGCS